ncbi:aa3-type cytochrome c oxidase subunit IV [Sphingomonas sp.]
MADNGRAQFKAHEQTYGGFLGLLKYGAIAAFVVAAIVVFIVAS